MNAYLMNKKADFVIDEEISDDEEMQLKDLGLDAVLDEMAHDDKTVMLACKSAFVHPQHTKDDICYRQSALQDAINHPNVVFDIYSLLNETAEKKRHMINWLTSEYISNTFSDAVSVLRLYTDTLSKLAQMADRSLTLFHSAAFRRFFTILKEELSEEYLDEVRENLDELKENDGYLISAELGDSVQGIDYQLLKKEKNFKLRWLLAPSYTLNSRDDLGFSDLGVRRDRAINESADVLAKSAEQLESFFKMLQNEIAFYVGCLNLKKKIEDLQMPYCIPNIQNEKRSYENLYDLGLVLRKSDDVIRNSLDEKNAHLYLITGASQGGKSSYLKSIGQCQTMGQCGMFVPAEQYEMPAYCGIYTHFARIEDASMKSGRLDEELTRMEMIAAEIEGKSLILFDESFASTNEREGSEVLRQITQALLDNGMDIFAVTHLYTYACGFADRKDTFCLEAERKTNGERTYRIIPGKPSQTGYGEDLYRRIFK